MNTMTQTDKMRSRKDGNVEIHAFDDKVDYAKFRGFTYILPCSA